MDSITHILAGAAIGALIAPSARRRAAMLVGAIAGSLPDIDNLFLAFADPVTRFVEHRSASHSLLLLPIYAVLAFGALRVLWKPTREAPWRWFAAIFACLLSHVLLDAATVYGTRLFWPIDKTPVMGSLFFIIDPMLTLPLLVGVAIAFFKRDKPQAGAWLALTLSLSMVYAGWAAIAKWYLEDAIRAHFAARSSEPIELLTMPTPFNTLIWRAVVITKEGYFEGYYSFLRDGGFVMEHYPGDRTVPASIESAGDFAKLRDFTRGYYRIDRRDGQLQFVDLRMGGEPDYVFRFGIGEATGEGDAEPLVPAEQAPVSRGDIVRFWRRFEPMLKGAATPAASMPATHP